jgi:hypothetical protein
MSKCIQCFHMIDKKYSTIGNKLFECALDKAPGVRTVNPDAQRKCGNYAEASEDIAKQRINERRMVEARRVCSKPSKEARRTYIANVEELRGKDVADQLKEDVRALWGK